MDKKWISYDFLDSLKKAMTNRLLTVEHLVPFKIEIKKMSLPDGSSMDEYNFRGWELRKDSTRYLISDAVGTQEVNITNLLPVLPKNIIEVGAKGLVYSHVKTPKSMRLKEEQSMGFKEFVDKLTELDHSNPSHYKLIAFNSLASVFFRYNSRICSNPGFGKDSSVELHNALIGKCGAVESPTLAKIEERASILRWLVVNEAVDIGGAEWRIIQQFLLASAAHKTQITKHSRAHGGVGEVIDLSNLSLSLFYNDITEYSDSSKYFDFITKGAVKDRFPAIRVYGEFTEDFNELGRGDPDKYAKANINDFKQIAYNYAYYKKNIENITHHYDRSRLTKVTGRDSINLGRLLTVIDAYCDTQEEFNEWIEVLNSCMADYQSMLKYPRLLEDLFAGFSIPKTRRETMRTINDAMGWLREKGFDYAKRTWFNKQYEYNYSYARRIVDAPTFIEKNKLIHHFKPEDALTITDKNVWGD